MKRWRVLLGSAAGLLVVALSLLLYTGRDSRGPVARLMLDAPYYHAYLASLVEDHDLDFADEYHRTGNYENFGRVAATGRLGNVFGIGPPLFSAPFYAAGMLLARWSDDRPGGFGDTQVKITLLASPFFTGLSLLFIARLVRRRVGGTWIPIAAGVAAILGGSVFYYAVRQPGNSHPVALFFTAWLIDAWDASYDGPRSLRVWLLLGALYGATVLARPQLALWGVLPVAAAVDDLRRGRLREALPRWLAAGATAAAVFTPQLLAWKAVYGAYLVVPQGPGFMVWQAPRWSEVLFSSRNGLYSWTPLYALATIGLLAGVRRAPRTASLLLLGFALQVFTNGAAWDWWAGPSFGARRFDSCVPAFALGLAVLATLRHRLLAWLCVGLSVLAVGGNVRAAQNTGVWDLMMSGGRPIRDEFAEKAAPWLSAGVAALSEVATFPARAAFALEYGTDLERYDWVVGTHFTSEFFPGLGGIDRRLQMVKLKGDEPFLDGFERAKGGARLRGARGRMLIPLNKRHGPVLLRLRFQGRASMRAWWDGRPIGRVEQQPLIELRLDPVERGVHVLDLEGAPGTRIYDLLFDVPPGTPP